MAKKSIKYEKRTKKRLFKDAYELLTTSKMEKIQAGQKSSLQNPLELSVSYNINTIAKKYKGQNSAKEERDRL